MKKVITTVGTSIFTNFMKYKDTIEDKYENLKDKPFSDWTDEKYDINKVKESVISWAKNNNKASAEIKSILKIKQEVKEYLDIYLLSTDTILSVLASEIIKDLLSDTDSINIVFDIQEDVIKGLQVNDKKVFEKQGLVNLINKFEKITQGYYENTILNITGGYKALIPYLTIVGQIYNVPIYYIFEETDKLIRFPQAPIDINWGVFEKYSSIFEELYNGIIQKLKIWDVRIGNFNHTTYINDFKTFYESNKEAEFIQYLQLKT